MMCTPASHWLENCFLKLAFDKYCGECCGLLEKIERSDYLVHAISMEWSVIARDRNICSIFQVES